MARKSHPNALLDAALDYAARGWRVVPLHPRAKNPRPRDWPTVASSDSETIRSWWTEVPDGNVGIALGYGTGLVAVDIDSDAGSKLLIQMAAGDLPPTCEMTTGKGSRLLFAIPDCLEMEPRTTVIKIGKDEALRFQSTGGQCVMPPSIHPGDPEKSIEPGRVYTWVEGRSPANLEPEGMPAWLIAEMTRPTTPVYAEAPSPPVEGQGWNHRADWWADILLPAGWTPAGKRNDGVEYVTRPGKARGCSATIGHYKAKDGTPALYVFTDSGGPLDAGRCYDKFGAFTHLFHGGDFQAAAAALRGRGNAPPERNGAKNHATGNLNAAPMPQAPLFTPPVPISVLKAGEPGGDWFWHGYFAKHTTTLLSALWKAGKTTLLAHLLKALGSGGEFCGRTVKPTRVLYATEEAESTWAKRRDKLGIGDHVWFQIRPFKAKPRMPEWVGLLQHLRSHVESGDFGMVIIDPLTTLWPVDKENEAGMVSEALVPLNLLTERAGVAIIHHLRKGDGNEATASRGSGALPGYVDTILELRRHNPTDRNDRRRVLSGWGRFDETPEELVIELTDGGYIAHGKRSDLRQKQLLDILETILPPVSPGWGWQAIKEALDNALGDGGPGPSDQRLIDLLREGATECRWSQTGSGKRGDPYRFWRPFQAKNPTLFRPEEGIPD